MAGIWHDFLKSYKPASRDLELELTILFHHPQFDIHRADLGTEFKSYSDAQLQKFVEFGDRALCELHLRKMKKLKRAVMNFMRGAFFVSIIGIGAYCVINMM